MTIEKIICDNCFKEIDTHDESCPRCGVLTDYKREENRPSRFREHAEKSAYPGRDYKPAKPVSLLHRILRRLGYY